MNKTENTKMVSKVLCPRCNGKKKLIGLGYMEKLCKNCKGIGSIEMRTEHADVDKSIFIVDEIEKKLEKELKPKAKRGRPRKMK